MKKLKVTAVSYLNTKPFLYGLLKEGLHEKIELKLDIPSRCAEKMRTGEAQLGLIPVAAIPEIAGAQIVSDYCIGTIGAVKTVCIYANQPIQQLSHLYLDFHSRTSVELTKILLRQYWKIDPILIPAKEGYISKIDEKVGGLVIGDRTIGLEHQFEYVYDLGEMWEKFTGLPFVFAAWVSTVPLSSKFMETFNNALKVGLMSIPDLLYLLQAPHPDFDLETYFNQYISYELDEKKKTAMRLFWREMAENKKHEHQINTTVNLH